MLHWKIYAIKHLTLLFMHKLSESLVACKYSFISLSQEIQTSKFAHDIIHEQSFLHDKVMHVIFSQTILWILDYTASILPFPILIHFFSFTEEIVQLKNTECKIIKKARSSPKKHTFLIANLRVLDIA